MKRLRKTKWNLIAYNMRTGVKRHTHTGKTSAESQARGLSLAGRYMGREMSIKKVNDDHYTVVALTDIDKSKFII